MSSSTEIKKYDINKLSLIFKEKILLNSSRVEDLKKYAIEGQLTKEYLRPIAWKIFLGVLPNIPNTTSLKEWVEIISNQREEYKNKFKKYCKIKKIVGDPLGESKKKKKSENSVEDTKIKNLINIDLDRTYQEIDLFLQNKTRNILANVLYIWAKENPEVSYRQGMHELLANILIVLYPFYFSHNTKPKYKKEDILDFLKDVNLYQNDIYLFFHDEEEIQADLFYTFESLMKKGMTNLFDPHILQKDEPGYKLYEIFPQMWKDDSNEDKPTYVYRRSSLLIKEKLKSLDNELYSHFKKIDLNCEAFLQRYLRCIFCREFNLNDVFIIWDIIFHDYYINRSKEKYDFIYMEYIAMAMIFKIRDSLKDGDQNECFSMLFKYPEIKDIMEIVKLSKKVEAAINERLSGKNSDIYDILGIMRPIQSEPSQIFNKNIFDIESDNDDVEKDNINLDSLNYKNKNLKTETKKFINNAIYSLSNFGEKLKDQIQNVKDTVIDSLKGNDLNTNYNYDINYKENNVERNYIELNNKNDNNINLKNNIDINNNENKINSGNYSKVNNEQKNEENEKEELMKTANDSSEEFGYNKKDIMDIVDKLKEMDTKYNMFFNDEDKKNFRIIINYLNKNM